MLVTGDRKMRVLNRDYRGRDYPTDVLSFPAMSGEELSAHRAAGSGARPDSPPPVLGDVVISAPRALEQAAGRGRPFEEELVFLLAHGILHLAGYDHEKGQAAEGAMRRKQRELMARLKAV